MVYRAMLAFSVLLESDEIPILDAHPLSSSVMANVSWCIWERWGTGEKREGEREREFWATLWNLHLHWLWKNHLRREMWLLCFLSVDEYLFLCRSHNLVSWNCSGTWQELGKTKNTDLVPSTECLCITMMVFSHVDADDWATTFWQYFLLRREEANK